MFEKIILIPKQKKTYKIMKCTSKTVRFVTAISKISNSGPWIIEIIGDPLAAYF